MFMKEAKSNDTLPKIFILCVMEGNWVWDVPSQILWGLAWGIISLLLPLKIYPFSFWVIVPEGEKVEFSDANNSICGVGTAQSPTIFHHPTTLKKNSKGLEELT